jgi:predicted membrane protein
LSEKGIPAADAGADDSFWRSLRFFTIYRLSIAALFLVAALAFGDTISLGTQDARLFGRVAAVYLLLAVGFWSYCCAGRGASIFSFRPRWRSTSPL